MFNRKKEIVIKTNEIPIDILKKHLVSFPYNMPKYFKDIPSTLIDNLKRKIRSKRTIKSCSGFINLFKRSIVFTSPFDMELFKEHGKIRGTVGEHDLSKYFNYHADYQFIEYAKSDYTHILKLCLNFNIQCDKTLIISNPWWHMNKFEIVPGLINCKEPLDLNIFIAIKRDQNHIYIPQNTPLCYINFETEEQLKLVFKDKNYKYSDYQGLYYRFSNLKDRLLNNILK